VSSPVRTFGLSPLQKGMLFHHLLDPHSGVDIEQMVIDLRENIDSDRLTSSWNLVIARRELLRAGFDWGSRSEPVHVVAEQATITMRRLDLTSLDSAGQERATAEYLTDDRRAGFDLAQPPLMRLTLAVLGPDQFRLFWTFHHLLMDGRSFTLILREVFESYECLASGRTIEFVPSPSYREYIGWLETLDLSGADSFWKNKLEGMESPTALPLDPGRLSTSALTDASQYGEVEIRVPREATEFLHAFAREENVTLNTMLQAAWGLLLARHNGARDVLFGATKTTRTSSIPGARGSVGLFLVTLPLRLEIPADTPVGEWLRGVRAEWIALRPFEQVPLTDIAKWAPFRSSAGLFDSLVVFENSSFEADLQALGPPWTSRHVRLLEQTNFGLSLLGYGGTTLRLKLEFDGRRYTPATARRLLSAVEHLLRSFASDRDRPVGRLSVLTAEEQEQILVEWNATNRPYDARQLVPELVSRHARRTPDRIVVCSSEYQVTYIELDRRVNNLANHLRRLGVGPEVLVGIGIERSIEMVVALLGVMKAGGAYVPLDPAFPAERLEFMVKDSGLGLLLTSRATSEIFRSFPGTRVNVEDVGGDGVSTVPAGIVGPHNLAYVLYTSGSTGRPKGVQIEHQNLINFLHSMTREPGILDSDVLLSITTISFDIAGLEIFLPLVNGARLIVVTREVAADGRELVTAIRRYQPTIMQATPATWRMLAAVGLGSHRFSKVLCGGEALSEELAAVLLAHGSEVWNMYGPTETTIWSTVKHLRSMEDPVTIGRPVNNTRLYVLDSDLRPMPLGAVGELCIGGDGLSRGYLNHPELTAEKFVPDPFVAGARVYRTGDLARYLSNGEVECLGRLDNQVKIRGFRIELGEIEAVLETHDEVRQAVVVKRASALVAYVVPTGSGVSSDLRAFLHGRLPPYMLPSDFVVMKALPLTPNNKVDRKALPEPLIRNATATIEQPASEEEKRMVGVWERILNRHPVSIATDFFDLGGDSLLAVDLVLAVEDEFHVRLPLSAIMEAPTVRQLVQLLHAGGSPRSQVSKMQDGSAGSPPVWCIPGAAGHIVTFRHLVGRLPANRTIFGLEYQNTGGILEPSIEEVAQSYLRAIRETQPSGPYLLLGLCLGALLAFEVARQLEEVGERVGLLGLLDPPTPKTFLSPHTVLLIARAHLEELVRSGPKLPARLRSLGRAVMSRARTRIMKVSPRISDPEDRQAASVAEFDRVRDRRIAAGRRYVPGTYPGNALLLIANQNGIASRISTQEGWRRVVRGKLVVYSVPGDHSNFFLAPHVQELAQLIEREMESTGA
jgi:amino acid adenylation domain-containing protein